LPEILHVALTLQLKIKSHKTPATIAEFPAQKKPVLTSFVFLFFNFPLGLYL